MLHTVMENSTNASVIAITNSTDAPMAALTSSTEDWTNASTVVENVTEKSVLRSHDGELELYLTVFYLMAVLLLVIVCKYVSLMTDIPPKKVKLAQ